MSINLQLQAIVTVLSLVNPMVCGAIFVGLVAGRPRREQTAHATKAVLAMLIILELGALLGAKVLELFGVSIDAFSVAGGMVLTWMGFAMLRGGSRHSRELERSAEDHSISLSPLVLFAASPATITGVITLAVSHAGQGLPITAIVAVAVSCLATWMTLLVFIRVGTHAKKGLVQDTVRSFMGLIIVAMGVQFALKGVRGFFDAG